MLGLGNWYAVRDGDARLVDLYERHYSANKTSNRVQRIRFGVSGVGESMVLLTVPGDAGFIWIRNRIERYDHQEGVQCSFFRNESGVRSSDLIREAMELAWGRWTGERLYTYVNPERIKSVNPGYAFKVAGWRFCGRSKGGLHILECLPCWELT